MMADHGTVWLLATTWVPGDELLAGSGWRSLGSFFRFLPSNLLSSVLACCLRS